MKEYIKNIFNNVDITVKLDEEQINIVEDDSKNLIVIAAAGSGKTTTIAAKVKYLVEVKSIKAEEILIISLTNKAIDELKKRINYDFGINVRISTFHKLAYDLLRQQNSLYSLCKDTTVLLEKIIRGNKKTAKIIKYLRKDNNYKKIEKNYIDSVRCLVDFSLENIKLIKTISTSLEKKSNKYMSYLDEIMYELYVAMRNNNFLDFEDMIIEATKIDKIECNYKYIIVDEYQDISQSKFFFLKKIIDDTNANTIVVGDDYQTIFSFAGSKIELFLNFQSNMNAKLLRITKTYRNSQQLIDVAGRVIGNNKGQIYKRLISNKFLNKPIRIIGYKDNFNIIFEKIIEEVIEKNGEDKTILILGRYKSDVNFIDSNNFLINNNAIIYKKNKKISITFLTIHASKGLGYDNVILINFLDDTKGFPSKIEDTNIRNMIMNENNKIDEEYRLLYVAMTRTKNYFYILSPIGKESTFIYDFIDDKNVYINYKFANKKVM